jgi:hypothetical protein
MNKAPDEVILKRLMAAQVRTILDAIMLAAYLVEAEKRGIIRRERIMR